VAGTIFRVATKVLIDFTGFLQMRHAFEGGGLHFTLSLVWSQISSFIFVFLYQLSYNEEGENDGRRVKISATVLYSIASSLVLVWSFSFYSFIRKIDPKYLHTFFDTMTGSQYTIHLFRAGDDRIKMGVFATNAIYWVSIHDEVKAWTLSNWDRWNAEKPDWFTEQLISTIPDEFIPRPDKNRRRSSVFASALGLPGVDASLDGRKRSSKVSAISKS
jgi:hypothetical protein